MKFIYVVDEPYEAFTKAFNCLANARREVLNSYLEAAPTIFAGVPLMQVIDTIKDDITNLMDNDFIEDFATIYEVPVMDVVSVNEEIENG